MRNDQEQFRTIAAIMRRNIVDIAVFVLCVLGGFAMVLWNKSAVGAILFIAAFGLGWFRSMINEILYVLSGKWKFQEV